MNNSAAPAPGGFIAALNEALQKALVEGLFDSYAQVARAAGLEQSHFSNLRAGKHPHPQAKTIRRLSQVLEAPELLDYIGATPSIDSQTLQALHEEVSALRDEVRQLREALVEQQSPPPDETQSR